MKDDALVQFKLLLPAGLKARVEAAATNSRRSLSQEIVAALEEAFPPPVAIPDWSAFKGMMAEVEHVGTEEEFNEGISRLNQFLAGTGNGDFEVFVDPSRTSPRRSGKALALRPKR